jgi:hypothetical protein
MTKIEREALQFAVADTKSPHVSREELAMLDSREFKLGWQRAIESISARIHVVLSVDSNTLKRQMRTWRS